MEVPLFFNKIRLNAAARWDQLEHDRELAGPWHQLFRQVQSPRHVLSELLQNADDAQATRAGVKLAGNQFIFFHNGEDFTEEHFASLCRFGYSNKRVLHTIGFRGIGFKSTFSLGNQVELYTPSLSVIFKKDRFTEPLWVDPPADYNCNYTEIRVTFTTSECKNEIEKNINDWLLNPVSLLFFRNIRSLQFSDKQLHWDSCGPGPAEGTEWMILNGNVDKPYLLARSEAVEFPADALAEIKSERQLPGDEDSSFPPCKIEIVLYAEGRIYSVLPTGIVTALPYAVNGPFLQDPARLKIKDPAISPTNRWLLERTGKLAAAVMLQYLENTSLSLKERCEAYDLLSFNGQFGNTLESSCSNLVTKAFREYIENKAFLLSDSGQLKLSAECVSIPDELKGIWLTNIIESAVIPSGKFLLAQDVKGSNVEILQKYGDVNTVTIKEFSEILCSKQLPKPATWAALLKLWEVLHPEICNHWNRDIVGKVNILPVQGKDDLQCAEDVVRLGEKRLLQSDEDWAFLEPYQLVMNQNWTRFLAEQRRKADEENDPLLKNTIHKAFQLLNALGFDTTSELAKIVSAVSKKFFGEQQQELSDCIRLSQLFAKLNAPAGEYYKCFTRDGVLRSTKDVLIYDEDGSLEVLFTDEWIASHFLHEEYTKNFKSCSKDDWKKWSTSGMSGLHLFTPVKEFGKSKYGRDCIRQEFESRGGELPANLNTYCSLRLFDKDFDPDIVSQWENIAQANPSIWALILEKVLMNISFFPESTYEVKGELLPSDGRKKKCVIDKLTPAWILRFREWPCIYDTQMFKRKPYELFFRTPETEALLGVEPFVHALRDTEATRPLLKLLGVRDKALDAEPLLNRLRALSKSEKLHLEEITKLYNQVDMLMNNCTFDISSKIQSTFKNENLIITENGNWAKNDGSVFISSGEEHNPDFTVIKLSMKELKLWGKLRVPELPNSDTAIGWLKKIPSGKQLTNDELKNAKSLTKRYPERIWLECGHWLNLEGEWVPTKQLTFALSMKSLVTYTHLHQWVKKQTADFRELPEVILTSSPFSGIPSLAQKIENKFSNKPQCTGIAERKPWLQQLGKELTRLKCNDVDEQKRIRTLAAQLASTVWKCTNGLDILPYIDGKPAGTLKTADVVWYENVLYIQERPIAKLAKNIADELGKIFENKDIQDAIKICFDHLPSFVTEYVETNFSLEEPDLFISSAGNENSPDAYNSTAESFNEQGFIENETSNLQDDLITESYDPQKSPEMGVFQESEATKTTTITVKSVHHPAQPSLFEQFVQLSGFKKANNGFIHPDGNRIIKSEAIFPWELVNPAGSTLQYYYPYEHCIESGSLQIKAEIWNVLESHGEMYVLIVYDADEKPVSINGKQLREWISAGTLEIFPHSYRLIYKKD